jgi:hypothetical protein
MTTPRIHSVVSLAAVLVFALSLGACASSAPRVETGTTVAAADAPRSIRFDNTGREYVHVYLVGEQREWLLGRVEPGARASLRIPAEATAEDVGWVQLVVVVGERVSLGAKSASRQMTTVVQPGADLFSQRWTFSQTPAVGQLTSLPLKN